MFVSVDVEADGPCPGPYSMLSVGAIVVEEKLYRTFYGELAPISDKYIPEALAVSGFSREQVLGFRPAEDVMKEMHAWCLSLGAKRLIFLSDNNGFDWQFVNYYFHTFCGNNPFGHSSFNLGSFYKGLDRNLRSNFKHLRKTRHTHNALDDARGNAEAMLEIQRRFKIY